MSTTEEILTILEDRFVGWERDGPRGILHYLNIAQNILYNIDSEQTMIIDESTGNLPTIDTSDGVFAYDLPSTVRNVREIVVDSASTNSLITINQDYGANRLGRVETITISNNEYYRIRGIRSYPANEDNVAKIVFTSNPGDTTGIYRYVGFLLATQLTADTVPLSIHSPYDMTILMPATATLIETKENGNYLEGLTIIEREFVPRMKKAFCIGAYGTIFHAEDRGY